MIFSVPGEFDGLPLKNPSGGFLQHHLRFFRPDQLFQNFAGPGKDGNTAAGRMGIRRD